MSHVNYPPIANIEPMGLTAEARLFAQIAEDARQFGTASLFRALATRIEQLESDAWYEKKAALEEGHSVEAAEGRPQPTTDTPGEAQS